MVDELKHTKLPEGDLTMREHVMTDMTNYARRMGMDDTILFSPQVLIDIKDVPKQLRHEDDVVRIMRVLGELKLALSASYGQEVIPFRILLTLGRDDEGGMLANYDLVAKVTSDAVEVFCEGEKLKATRENIMRIKKLRQTLSPPRPWLKEVAPRVVRSGLSY